MLRACLALAALALLTGQSLLMSYALVGAFGAMALALLLGRKSRLWY